VLVVDDDARVRALIVRVLHKGGFVVVEAASADDAVDVFETEPEIAALVTDVVMPGGSGVRLAATLRQRRPDLPVIILSGFEGQQLGAFTPNAVVLSKPFSPRVLVDALHGVCAASCSRPAEERLAS
jgi:CheY-like chemotaxis protein